MRFAANSDPTVAYSDCAHPVLHYVVDCGWHTIMCPACGSRWSLMGPRAVPRYSENGLLNHRGRDPHYTEDDCVDVTVPMGVP